ncbi:MerR family transcription regulator [Streptomyces himastatinicus ATCC 53653]|uniref:MerR family transcription regulator n=1 Tax=Streptomyces himastatinicus ATCC 53653 TaxID=457427 RepID=D9WT00_9ACTN|nr:MerR family transcriptional regulator [Streptomyces himastatinicus]EFL24275.1 MerR family transcription regulator [Streptomyces himastatinicus ATCC 53653]
MRIGELAAQAGVSVRALRYYEEQRLLHPARSASGQRHYPESAVDRVHLIQQLYAAGLSSRSIVQLMPCVDTGEATPAMLELLLAERDRIERQMGELAEARDRLDTVIASTKVRTCVHQPPRHQPPRHPSSRLTAAAGGPRRRPS